jgi:hypothetical protein
MNPPRSPLLFVNLFVNGGLLGAPATLLDDNDRPLGALGGPLRSGGLPRRLPFDLPLPFDLRRASLRHLTFCRSIKYYKAFTALQDHARNRLIRAL